ncbi:hypothetical protein DLM76_07220 [Leptospira yasudae]|uniref:Lipoprotein n=1 Tax=Leptospira yasudae TaxID=2202201 RepID=A0ABX9MC01_9LEPT|nr:hypothetical protein [Leptospira yasudae]RHX82473.1 hypothetical protein DLM77_01125 [Leptospira yasudae]RHX95401.1 hypothetical protein DLM76_07220 [Leptospira yasudae]TGK30526.1 hypothetical protein EHQ05_06140 [Leptospira yasudae]TGM04094.1 hypothetical protein EHQ86_12595 [Leptospira yasudae]
MKKIYIVVLVMTFVAFVSHCSEISPRQKCYEDNYCKSAESDCIAGSLLISSLLANNSSGSSSSSSNTSSSNSFLSVLFSPITCIGAKASCEADCDKKHPF